ncbi:MAG: (2Fe-2S)-binding protein [Polyangiales bacterium]
MIVCHCFGVTDRDIRAAVGRGANCTEDVKRECSAGGGCGGCAQAVQEVITSAQVRRKSLFKLPIAAILR